MYKREFKNDTVLTSNYNNIISEIITSNYYFKRLEIIGSIRNLIQSYANQKESIIAKMIFDVESEIENYNQKYPENKFIKDWIESANLILLWLKNGLGEYKESEIKQVDLQKKLNDTYFNLFEKFITGSLKPHLINDENLSEINILLSFKVIKDNETGLLKFDSEYIAFCTDEDQKFELTIDEGKDELIILKDEKLQDLINIDIPPPPDEKSERYLMLIEFEVKLIKHKIKEFIKSTNEIESLELFAKKSILTLKKLGRELYIYIKQLGGDDNFLNDSNHFVCYILKYYIIDLILHIQDVFSSFVKIEFEGEKTLKYKLFNENYNNLCWLRIYDFLPKEFETFKKQFIVDNKKELEKNKLTRKGLNFGKTLFEYYKSLNNGLNNIDSINNYINIIDYWNKLLITGELKVTYFDNWINNPDIEKTLIPLLKSEIELLEKITTTTSTSSSSSKNKEITGFQSSLTLSQIENLYKQLQGTYINTTIENFNLIFKDKQLPDNFIKIRWILLTIQNKPHKTALREFITLILKQQPKQSMIDNLFTDKKGNSIILAKPKKNEYSNYYNSFENILKEL